MGGSSSHRHRHRHRRRHSSSRRRHSPTTATTSRSRPVPTPSTTRELSFADLTITTGVGYDLLLKSGWQPGSPLGASPLSAASSTPLPIRVKRGRAGLGAPQVTFAHQSVSPLAASERVRHLADGVLFDPLRPRCRFDDGHVVSSLRSLRKHEMGCPSNPRRGEEVGRLMAALTLGEMEMDGGQDHGYESDEEGSESGASSGMSSVSSEEEEVGDVEMGQRMGLGFGRSL